MARTIFLTHETPDASEINRAVQRGNRLRAEAFAALLRSVYRILTIRPSAKFRQKQHAYRPCSATT